MVTVVHMVVLMVVVLGRRAGMDFVLRMRYGGVVV